MFDALIVGGGPVGVFVSCVLVRPDGFVAWSRTDPTDVRTALRAWFGEPRPAAVRTAATSEA